MGLHEELFLLIQFQSFFIVFVGKPFRFEIYPSQLWETGLNYFSDFLSLHCFVPLFLECVFFGYIASSVWSHSLNPAFCQNERRDPGIKATSMPTIYSEFCAESVQGWSMQ